jgi:hypothetical protein
VGLSVGRKDPGGRFPFGEHFQQIVAGAHLNSECGRRDCFPHASTIGPGIRHWHYAGVKKRNKMLVLWTTSTL